MSKNWCADVPDYDVGHIALVNKVKLPEGHTDGLSADCWFQEANKTEKKFKTEEEIIGKNHSDYCFNILFSSSPP